MSIKSIGERMSSARKNKNLTQAEVCKLGGIHKASYSNWENNRRTPSLIDSKKLEGILGVSAAYILNLTDIPTILGVNKNGIIMKPFNAVPLYNDEQLSLVEDMRSPLSYIPLQECLSKSINKSSFAYLIDNDSMMNVFNIGDIAIFTPNNKAKHNDYILVKSKANKQILLRQYYVDHSDLEHITIRLEPLNNQWPTVTIENNEQISILGVMHKNKTIFS